MCELTYDLKLAYKFEGIKQEDGSCPSFASRTKRPRYYPHHMGLHKFSVKNKYSYHWPKRKQGGLYIINIII